MSYRSPLELRNSRSARSSQPTPPLGTSPCPPRPALPLPSASALSAAAAARVRACSKRAAA
eukprot:58284-Chlamydomonas_euryale.AAC.1